MRRHCKERETFDNVSETEEMRKTKIYEKKKKGKTELQREEENKNWRKKKK